MERTLQPPAPFTLQHIKRVYSLHSDSSCCWEGNSLYMVFQETNSLVLVKIQELGKPDQPLLHVATSTRKEFFPDFSHIFSFQDDLKEFYSSVRSDPIMNQLISRYYGTRIFHTRDFFESAIIAILEQQISVQVAAKLRERIVQKFGRGPIEYDGMVFRSFPTPLDFLGISVEEIGSIGMSMNKAKAIHHLANALIEGKFQSQCLSPQSIEQSIKKLISLPGIGSWSAQYILTRGLAWDNMVAYSDLGIRKAIGYYYKKGQSVTVEESREFFEHFSPWKHIAGYYFLMDLIIYSPY